MQWYYILHHWFMSSFSPSVYWHEPQLLAKIDFCFLAISWPALNYHLIWCGEFHFISFFSLISVSSRLIGIDTNHGLYSKGRMTEFKSHFAFVDVTFTQLLITFYHYHSNFLWYLIGNKPWFLSPGLLTLLLTRMWFLYSYFLNF